MENAGFLLAAFTVAWAVLFGYVVSLLSKQRKLQMEINSLRESLKAEKGNE